MTCKPLISIFSIMTLAAVAYAQPVQPGFSASVETSFSGEGDISHAGVAVGEADALSGEITLAYTSDLTDTQSISTGLLVDYYSFDGSYGFPDELYGLALTLDYKWFIDKRWGIRVSVAPGFYSDLDDISSDAFNLPGFAAVSYRSSDTLTWFGVVVFNPRSEMPVIGGLGVRWQFADRWTLSLLLPEPRVEYAISEDLMVFVGGSISGGTWLVPSGYGASIGQPAIAGEYLDFREIRLGGGIQLGSIGANQAGVFKLEAGYVVDREWEVDNTTFKLEGDSAWYVGGSLTVRY